MEQIEKIKRSMKVLKITEAASVIDELLLEAQRKSLTYQQFLAKLINHEVNKREEKQLEKRLCSSAIPIL